MVTRCSCCWQCEQNGLYGRVMTRPTINTIAMSLIEVHFIVALSSSLEIRMYLVYLKNAGKRSGFSPACFVIYHYGDIGTLLLKNPLVILGRIDIYHHPF